MNQSVGMTQTSDNSDFSSQSFVGSMKPCSGESWKPFSTS
jgi:hypothetical protein